ncbi:BHLH domain-containing protein [Meloidogyne graminicola]|uniref:BHLH domain-containing protein n=1 Tax=Meloidogyne graminicola TaxID=189291 RepID=A0A8T0A3M7_9BILA|nr:BHLH domain-containing protein [Meloidogyne graminicola]
MAKERIEPYVRRRHNSGSSSERSRKRQKNLNEEEQNILRININSRERKRMHDINDELDELRRVLPYTDTFEQQKELNEENQKLNNFKQNSTKKLSKINTIILATNWIRHLNKELLHLRTENENLKQQILNNGEEIKGDKEQVKTTHYCNINPTNINLPTNSTTNLLVQQTPPSNVSFISTTTNQFPPLQQNLFFQPFIFQNGQQHEQLTKCSNEINKISCSNGRRKCLKKNQGQNNKIQQSINSLQNNKLINTQRQVIENFASVQQLLAAGLQPKITLPICLDKQKGLPIFTPSQFSSSPLADTTTSEFFKSDESRVINNESNELNEEIISKD